MSEDELARTDSDPFLEFIKEGLEEAESMGIPSEVLGVLYDGLPASQVVTAHAIWEGVVKDTLGSLMSALSFDDAFDRDRMNNFLDRLPLNGQTGAIALLNSFYAVPETFAAHLKRLTWLRNQYAHSHTNLGNSYVQMVANVKEADRRQFLLDYVPIEPSGIPKAQPDKDLESLLSSSTSLSLFRFLAYCKSLKGAATRAAEPRKTKLKE